LKTGTFKLYYRDYYADFIIAVSEFANSALINKVEITLFNRDVWVTSKEDLLIFKLMANRTKDIADCEEIAKRWQGKLNTDYLLKWSIKLCDDIHDTRIYDTLTKLLKIQN
jgi:hypothetical protein